MPDQPTTVNAGATLINSDITAAAKGLVLLVEKMMLSDLPVLGVPGIKQVWEALFQWIAGYFVEAIESGATFTVIDSQVTTELGAVSAALLALISAEKTGDAAAISAAIKNYATAQSNLVRDNGSATAQ